MNEISPQPRYCLRAFVTDQGQVNEVTYDYGWSTFGQIFTRRGDHEQFAVAETNEHNIVVWDFYNLASEWSFDASALPNLTLPDYTSAIMAATLLARSDGD